MPDDTTDTLSLAQYAQTAYLEYALSVVKGRALPDVADGQKPVQRRILYSMQRMGLSAGGANGQTLASPVKSARVVGDVLGKYHPHGDSAAYEALVRMAQDFSQRYPLIDGQGNFGSRDGDGAAAMRYTEARLAPIASLLLEEIDEGTTEFLPNYDGKEKEPRQLPARLPFALLNGASGIAVGMACEIPSHNLTEVANACIALIKNPELPDEELFKIITAPDYPCGGKITSSPEEIQQACKTGKGSLKVRASWEIEELARGQWQIVINQLPIGTSTQKILQEIEELTNPRIKANKKALTPEQIQLKNAVLAVLDTVRDESNKDAPVRLVIEPKSKTVKIQELINTLLAHTSLETTAPINMTSIGIDGRPVQKTLRQMLLEWIEYRKQTVLKRSAHKLEKTKNRIHILEGRQIVLLNIDEVIQIIRQNDEPKPALITKYKLSEKQAEDILEIRLRQLAKLEAIKIEQELKELQTEQEKLQDIIKNPQSLTKLITKEIEQDTKKYGDTRRTTIEQAQKAAVEIKIPDEAITIIISQKGWIRTRQGHGHEAQNFTFKEGDALLDTYECRTIDTLLTFGSNGRIYSTPVSSLPGGRGDGQPITTFIELQTGTQAMHYWAGAAEDELLISQTGGYGFFAKISHMTSRQKAGKAFITLTKEEKPNPPAPKTQENAPIACITKKGIALTFESSQLRQMEKGGKGLQLINLAEGDQLAGAVTYQNGVKVKGKNKAGVQKEETLTSAMLENAKNIRAKKGKVVKVTFEIEKVAAF